MKKLFILTLLVFSTAVCVYATSVSKNSTKKHFYNKPGIQLHFIYASQRSGCERFPGICLISASVGNKTISYAVNEAYGSGYFESGILYLEIPKNQMGPGAKTGFANLAILPLDADLTIDAETSAALQSLKPITIMQGNYPIRDNGTSYAIAINCR